MTDAATERVSARLAITAAMAEHTGHDALSAAAEHLHQEVAGANTGRTIVSRCYWVTYEEVVQA